MTSYAVVGAGLAGSATAWRLAQRGHQVTLLERTTPANEHGSSHGSARIFRYGYPDPFWTELVTRARDGWTELEDQAGERLISDSGCLDFGTVRDPETLASVMTDCGVPHELVDPGTAAVGWPGIGFDSRVLWHPGAGVIDAARAALAMVALAERAGATVCLDWTLASIHPDGASQILVSTDGAEVRVDHVVIAAGGWLPDLLETLPGDLAARLPPFQVRQEQAFHFPYRDQDTADAWPTFIHKTERIQVYSLPGGRDAQFVDGSGACGRGQKVAEYNGGPVISSASASTGVVDPANRQRVVDYVTEHLPGLVPEPYAESTCLFTTTPDEDFVIDTAGAVTVLSACSGHGAKFAPLLGTLAADSASGTAEVPSRFHLRPAPAVRRDAGGS